LRVNLTLHYIYDCDSNEEFRWSSFWEFEFCFSRFIWFLRKTRITLLFPTIIGIVFEI